MDKVLVTGSFDNLQARDMRYLEEASKFGAVYVLLWDDPEAKFPIAERIYFLEAVRYIDQVSVTSLNPLMIVNGDLIQGTWVWPEWEGSRERVEFCSRWGIAYKVIPKTAAAEFPPPALVHPELGEKQPKKVIVTGCYDWLHSGHVRFFEETSALGDLYVVVGHDANVRHLKGEGHPMFPQEQRRYMVGAIRHVKQALVSSGNGWMDAEPEIKRLQPDIYAVNEDGDKPEKRAFCKAHGVEYVVLKRTPKAGLPTRESTVLRGF